MDSMLNSTIFVGIESDNNNNKKNNNSNNNNNNKKQVVFNENENYSGSNNNNNNNNNSNNEGLDKFILDFDMFDINTGKVVSCDHSPPKYEPSLRWNTGINYEMEQHQQQIHKSINNIESLIEESEKLQQWNLHITPPTTTTMITSPTTKEQQLQIQKNAILLKQQQEQLLKLQQEQKQLESLRLQEQQITEKQQQLIKLDKERKQRKEQEQQEFIIKQQQEEEQQQLEKKEEKETILKQQLQKQQEEEAERKEKEEKENIIIECKDMSTTSKINQLQHYVNERFEISCVKFYSLMIDSDFWAYVSKECGFLEMNEGEWSTSETCCHQERLLNFKTPISFKIGPKVATVQQVQKIRRTPTNGYVMETSSISKDVPYGESFSVENYLSLEPCPDFPSDACILKVSTAVKFIKSIWGLGGLIEKTVTQSNKEFFAVWINFAKKRIFDQASIPETLTSVVTLISSSTILPSQSVNNTPKPSSSSSSSSILLSPPSQPQVSNDNTGINNSSVIGTSNIQSYDEIKKIFYKLFKEMKEEEKEETKVIKIFSVKKNQHLCNLTVSSKQTLSYLAQFLIPQMFPQLNRGQHFELYWIDKKNEYCQFFYKDLDQPIFSYICNLDVFGVQTLTEQQASNKLLSYVIQKSGENANIRYNSSNIDHSF